MPPPDACPSPVPTPLDPALEATLRAVFAGRTAELEAMFARIAQAEGDALGAVIAAGVARRPAEMVAAAKAGTDTLFRWVAVILVNWLLFNQFFIVAVLHGQHLAAWADAGWLNRSIGLFVLGFAASVVFLLREVVRALPGRGGLP